MTHPDGHRAALSVATPGLCMYCEAPLTQPRTGRHRIICGSPECERARNNAHHRDYRRAA